MAEQFKPKTFWQRPEGKLGTVVGAAGLLGAGWLILSNISALIALTASTIGLVVLLAVLAGLIYIILDPKFRNLMFYIYKSIMRTITGIFIQIDPIGVLRSYVDDLKSNLRKMDKQIANLRGQMRKLKTIITQNKQTINSNLAMANEAKKQDKKNIMILKSRKAGRMQESNLKLEDLNKKMEIMYRVLVKMYENSEILIEDVEDQVEVKKQERDAINASTNAMKSAMNIIRGKGNKKEMFDQAMEHIADDVGAKVGEMERFMEISGNFMDSVDLQNGVFEEEGLKMLEKWEKEGVSMILGDDKDLLVMQGNSDSATVDLDAPLEKGERGENQYADLFKMYNN